MQRDGEYASLTRKEFAQLRLGLTSDQRHGLLNGHDRQGRKILLADEKQTRQYVVFNPQDNVA
jgi:hypothetical protein